MSVDLFLGILFGISIIIVIIAVLKRKKRVDRDTSHWVDETLGVDLDDD